MYRCTHVYISCVVVWVYAYFICFALFLSICLYSAETAQGAESKEGDSNLDINLLFLPVRRLELILVFLGQSQHCKPI